MNEVYAKTVSVVPHAYAGALVVASALHEPGVWSSSITDLLIEATPTDFHGEAHRLVDSMRGLGVLDGSNRLCLTSELRKSLARRSKGKSGRSTDHGLEYGPRLWAGIVDAGFIGGASAFFDAGGMSARPEAATSAFIGLRCAGLISRKSPASVPPEIQVFPTRATFSVPRWVADHIGPAPGLAALRRRLLDVGVLGLQSFAAIPYREDSMHQWDKGIPIVQDKLQIVPSDDLTLAINSWVRGSPC